MSQGVRFKDQKTQGCMLQVTGTMFRDQMLQGSIVTGYRYKVQMFMDLMPQGQVRGTKIK
jgi:hypothetical protein